MILVNEEGLVKLQCRKQSKRTTKFQEQPTCNCYACLSSFDSRFYSFLFKSECTKTQNDVKNVCLLTECSRMPTLSLSFLRPPTCDSCSSEPRTHTLRPSPN